MIPGLVAYIIVMGAAMLALDRAGIEFGTTYMLWLTALNVVGVLGTMFWLDRKRVIVGSAWNQIRPRELR